MVRAVVDGEAQLRPFPFESPADLFDERRHLVVGVADEQGEFATDEGRLLRTAEAGEAGQQIEQ